MFATRVGSAELIEMFNEMRAEGTSPDGIPNVMDVARMTLLPEEQDDLGLGYCYALDDLSTFCCEHCGVTRKNMRDKGGKLRRCERCSTQYCSKECQRAEWMIRHKPECSCSRV